MMKKVWNPITQKFEWEYDESIDFTPCINIIPRMGTLARPDNEIEDNLAALKMVKGIVLQREAIIGLAQTSSHLARGSADAMVAAVANGAKRACFRFEAHYRHGSGCCSKTMSIWGKIEGEVEY